MADPSSTPSIAPPIVPSVAFELRGIGKRFHGVAALEGVDLAARAGEVHALVGENGAGKSTLIHVATGVLAPTAGEIRMDGEPVVMDSPVTAARHGVAAVHQEAELFAELSLAENMLLARGLVRHGTTGLIHWRATYEQARRELAEMGETMDPRAPAHTLSVGRRVIAEIAAAVAGRSRVLFLDEPTASLTLSETDRLFERLRALRARGVAIVYVSHRLEEVLRIGDCVTVLRNGRRVACRRTDEVDLDALVALMAGRAARTFHHHAHGRADEPPALVLRDVGADDGRLRGISFEVARGEIVGLYGLVGAGRSELAQALFGLTPYTGEVSVGGRRLRAADPAAAMAAGLVYVPEDRLTQGIFATHSCRENLTAAVVRRLGHWGLISRRRERETTRAAIERFRVKLASPEQAIDTLSGGNQQKLVLGRWLAAEPEVLLLDEPTRGVDVGAKTEIHRTIDELAERGKAVVLISSELPEIMKMSDRVWVMTEGRLAGEFDPKTATEEDLVAAAIPKAKGPARDADVGADEGVRRFFPLHPVVDALLRFRELGLLVALTLLCGAMTLARPDAFATVKNLVDVLTAASILSIVAAGMTWVVVSGGIDISIGSMLGLVAAAAGMLAMRGAPPWVALAAAVAFGAVLGAANSLLATLGRIHPIVVTLAGIGIYRGLMLRLTGGYEISPLPEAYRALGNGVWLSVPKIVWYAFAVLALNGLVLGRTLTGRRMLALGNSEKAARLIGLKPWRVRLGAFAALGGLVGLAAVLWGGYYGKIQSNTGAGFELQVVAAVVVGGCSIAGGRGTALGAFLGAVLIRLIYNALVLLQISAYWQDVFIGGLILSAVLVDLWLERLRAQ